MQTTKYTILFFLILSACTVKVDGPSQPTPTETVQQAPPTPTAPPPQNPKPFPPDQTEPPPAPADPNAVEAPVVSDIYCQGVNICQATLSWKPYKPYAELTPPGFDGYVVLARISVPDTLNQPGFRYVQYDRLHTFSGPINIQLGVHNYFSILPYYKPPNGPAIFRNRSVEVEAVAP